MSSGVETSWFNKNADEASARNSQRFLDFARNDKNRIVIRDSVKPLHRIYDSTVQRFNLAQHDKTLPLWISRINVVGDIERHFC
jgi:hypothetical protein